MIYLPTEPNKDVVAQIQKTENGQLGRFNIKDYYKENQFDKRSFQQLCRCCYCNHSFNPFSKNNTSVKAVWVWRTTEKPEKRYTIQCDHCHNEIRFILFIE